MRYNLDKVALIAVNHTWKPGYISYVVYYFVARKES